MSWASLIHLVVVQSRATAEGAAVKEVECELCGFHYVYRLQRTAEGIATRLFLTDQDATAQKAHAKLQRMLEEDCDPVPCPTCGWYQAAMVLHIRRQRYHRLLRAGPVLLLTALGLGAGPARVCRQRSGPGSRSVRQFQHGLTG
jgi:hypothetical protein